MYYLEGLRFNSTGIKKLALIFGSHGWARGGVRKIADDLEKCGFEIFDKFEVNYVPEKRN